MHEAVGQYLADKGITALFTFGTEANYIHDSGKGFVQEAQHFEDKQALINELKAYKEPADKILVKGSRGMKLEEVVEALK